MSWMLNQKRQTNLNAAAASGVCRLLACCTFTMQTSAPAGIMASVVDVSGDAATCLLTRTCSAVRYRSHPKCRYLGAAGVAAGDVERERRHLWKARSAIK